jgi:hypothetical protein
VQKFAASVIKGEKHLLPEADLALFDSIYTTHY